MTTTLAFDVYGTLIDTQGIADKLAEYIGDRAAEFSAIWREKQLEYSFRRGLMRQYENFAVCTRHALDYTDSRLQTGLDQDAKQALMDAYRVLPAFDDVDESLQRAKAAGFRLFAFSNGSAEAVQGLLEHAGLMHFFEAVVSVDMLKTFKPNPDVYRLFLDVSQSKAEQTWLISSNPFDVIGAVNIGMQAAWLLRSEAVIFDPWGIEPTRVITSLSQVIELY